MESFLIGERRCRGLDFVGPGGERMITRKEFEAFCNGEWSFEEASQESSFSS